jgi:hypothetical protein
MREMGREEGGLLALSSASGTVSEKESTEVVGTCRVLDVVKS